MTKLVKNARVVSTFVELNIKVRAKTPPKQIGSWLADRLQHLGPTYIKIGQFISSRSDIFGEEFTDQFSNLRDRVVPICRKQIKHVTQSLLKEHAFLETIDLEPLASASIGQVHKAKDIKGNNMIVKVRRPNIELTIEQDIDFLRFLVGLASKAPIENMNNTMTILDEFEAFLKQEVSFDAERSNLVRFYETYVPVFGAELLKVPRLVRNANTPDVIMMEYIHNMGFDQYDGDRAQLAKDIMGFFIRQLVQYGFLHGDPHKGNIGITSDNKIVVYDYGNMITLNDEERNLLKELIYMLILGNKYGVVKILGKLGVVVDDKEAVYEYIERYIQYMRTIDISVFDGLQTSNDKLPLHLSGKIIRIIRVYGILEGLCKELDPTFNYFKLLDEKMMDLALDIDFIDYKARKDMDLMTKFQNVVFKLMDE